MAEVIVTGEGGDQVATEAVREATEARVEAEHAQEQAAEAQAAAEQAQWGRRGRSQRVSAKSRST